MAHRGQWSEHEAPSVLIAWRKRAVGRTIREGARARAQRVRWWKSKLDGSTKATQSESALTLLPVQVTEPAPAKRGEPVAVYLRSGHIVKAGRGFDEEALARVVAVLERV
jgi:hypothetical protein